MSSFVMSERLKLPKWFTHTDIMKCSKYICYSDVTEDLEDLCKNGKLNHGTDFSIKNKNKIADIRFQNICGVSKVEIMSNGLDFWTYYPTDGEWFSCLEWTGIEHLPTSPQLCFSTIFITFQPRFGAGMKMTGSFSYREFREVSPIEALQAIPIVHRSQDHIFVINGGVMTKLEKSHELPNDIFVSCNGFTTEELQEQIDTLMKEKDFQPKYVRFEDARSEYKKNPDFKKAIDKQFIDLNKIISSYKGSSNGFCMSYELKIPTE